MKALLDYVPDFEDVYLFKRADIYFNIPFKGIVC